MKRTEQNDACLDRIRELEKTVADLGAALERSEKRFSGFYNNTLVGFFRSRISDGRMLACNERFARRSGYSSPEECCRLYRPEKHFADPGARDRMIQKLLEDGEIDNYEIRILRLDGSPAWVSLSASIFPDEECIEGAVIDITRHKSLVERLRRSEERNGLILKTAMDGLLVFCSDGEILLVNDALSAITGFTLDELSGMNAGDLFADPALQGSRGIVESVKTGPRRYETTVRGHDGIPREVEFSASYMQNHDCVFGFLRDMTERREAERARAASEEKYRRLVEDINEMILVVDEKGVVTYVSPMIYEIGGDRPEGVVGRNIMNFIHPDDQGVVRENIARRISGGEGRGSDYRILTSRGIKWMSVSSRPIFDNGKLAGIYCVMSDITERKQMEVSLRESEERFRRVYEDSPMGIALVGSDLYFTSVNSAFCGMLGYEEEEFFSLTFRDITHPEHLSEDAEQVNRLINGEIPVYRTEKRYIKKDKGVIWAILTLSPVRHLEGGMAHLLATIDDITERKNADELRRESEARYYELFNHMPSACAVYETENGGENFIIRDFNRAGENIEKLSKRDIVGKRVTDVFSGIVDFGLFGVFKRVWETGMPEKFPVTLYRDNRIEGWRENFVYKLPDGKIVALYSDETERRQAVEALRQSEEKYRFITENMNDIVWITDLGFNTTYVTPSIEKMLGFTPEERMRQSMEDMLVPDTLRRVQARFIEEMRLEEEGIADPHRSITEETEYYRKDGSTLWMESNVLAIRDESGAAIGLYGVARDISERKLAEAALRDSEERYRTLFNNAQVGLFRSGIIDGRIIACNVRFALLTGCRSQAECCDLYTSVGGFFQRVEGERMMGELMSRGELSGYEIGVIRRDGSTIWVSFTGKAFPGEGFIEGAIVDITKLKSAMERLRRSEERNSLILKTAMDGLLVFSADGKILLVNDALSAITGYRLDELSGMNLDKLFIDSSIRDHGDLVGLIKKGPRRYVTKIRGRNGDELDVELSATYMHNQDCVFGFVRDMTAQKEAEKALSASEEKYRSLVEEISDIIVSMDARGVITYISPMAYDISGYTAGEMIGRPITDFMFPDDISAVLENLDRRREGVAGRGYDYRMVMKSGELRWFRVSSRPLFAGGAFAGVHGVMTDITERKTAELALEESERRLNNILQGSPIPTFVIGSDHRVILWNKALEEYSSIRAEDIIGTSEQWRAFYPEPRPCLADLILEDERESIDLHYSGKHSISPVLDNAHSAIDFFPHVHGGTWFLFTAAPVYDSQGNYIGAIETLQDITERKKAEEALRQSEEKYRLIFDHSPLAIFHVDINGVMTACNDALIRIVGASRRSIVGRNLLTVPDELLRQSVKDALGGEQRWHEGDYQSVSGKNTVLRGVFVPMHSGGDIIGCFGIFEDITERKHADDALKASEMKYWTVANFTNDWVYWIGSDGGYVYVSPSCERITGYHAEEFMEDPDLTLRIVHREDLRQFRDHWIVDFREAGACELTYRIIRKDGVVRYISHNCLPVVDADGTFLGRRGSNRDVTDQYYTKEKILQGEAIARALIDTPGEPVLIIDTENMILDCNSAFQSHRKRPWGDLVGRSLREILEDGRCDAWEGMIEKVKESGTPCNLEESRDDGWYDTSIFPVRDVTGRVDRFVIETRDVSEIVRMQKHVMHVSELERMSIGQEIHDGLGQELTGVAFLVEVLEQKMTERGYPEAADIRRIADLIGRSIDHARLMSRTMFPARLEREGIAAALEDLAGMTGGIFKIECTCEVDEALRAMDTQKSNQFYHIALEAVNNAIKHGGPTRIHISLRESGSHVVLEVWNDGRGLDEKSSRRAGIGFNIMRYRSKILNGEFRSGNARDGGFAVSVRAAREDL